MTSIFFDLCRDRAARVGVISSFTSSFIAAIKNPTFLPNSLESVLACGLTTASICYISLKINALLRERKKALSALKRRKVARTRAAR